MSESLKTGTIYQREWEEGNFRRHIEQRHKNSDRLRQWRVVWYGWREAEIGECKKQGIRLERKLSQKRL